MSKFFLNLLQDDLFPKKPVWSLTKTVQLWGASVVIMVVWYLWASSNNTQLSVEANKLSLQEVQLEESKNELENRIANNKANKELLAKVSNAQFILKHKNKLNDLLTNTSSTHAKGFSRAMTELSQRHHKDISIAQVKLADDFILLSGVARAPESVPTWLTSFENTTFLSGQHFAHFALQENEQGIIEFSVSSHLDKVETK